MKEAPNLVWIDLEMTGLNPDNDVILEIATIVTDSALNILQEGPYLIIHQSDKMLDKMDEWVRTQHTKTGLVEKVRSSTLSLEQAEEKTLNFIREYCKQGMSPLCGNSVWQDRAFMRKYMPRIIDFLHYRIIDVSSIKELVLRWYADNPKSEFEKKDAHRALEDIRESIAELEHYRKHFFV